MCCLACVCCVVLQGLQSQGVLQQPAATQQQQQQQQGAQGGGGTQPDPETQQWLANPVLPDDVLREAVPGNIRRAEHFIAFLQRFLQHLRTRLQVNAVVSDTPTSFLQVLQAVSERRHLLFSPCSTQPDDAGRNPLKKTLRLSPLNSTSLPPPPTNPLSGAPPGGVRCRRWPSTARRCASATTAWPA